MEKGGHAPDRFPQGGYFETGEKKVKANKKEKERASGESNLRWPGKMQRSIQNFHEEGRLR